MAMTKLSNLVNPEVMADIISANLPKAIKFTQFAKVDTTLEGQAGNTITVPKYAYIGDAEDIGEGVTMGTVVLTASTTQATVKKAGKAVELSDESVLSGYGDQVGESTKQLTDSIAAKVDNDCVEALKAATLTYDGSANPIGYTAVVNAVDKFVEEDDEQKYLFVHPNQVTQLRLDADFTKASALGDSVIKTGVIGEIAGCQVIRSAKVPSDATTYTNFIVKEGALTIYLKRDVDVESDRDILNKSTVISADQHYVAVLSDSSKAVKFTTKK